MPPEMLCETRLIISRRQVDMLRDRFTFDPMFMYILRLTGITIAPELVEMDRILEDDELFQRVKHDLSQRHPKTLITGRNSTPVEVTMRMLAVKHLYDWSYALTVQFVGDSLALRWFCRIYLNPVCDDKTLLRWANLIQPGTLQLFNQRLDAIACELKLARGRKLRTDGMVVETHIHYPTDSSLLADGVRVLSRLLKGAKTVLQATAQLTADTFRDRNRSARNAARRIYDASRRRGEAAQASVQEAYRHLVRITQASVAQAKRVLGAVESHKDQQAQKLKAKLEQFIPRVEQVIAQTERRVFEGEKVPASEKIVSIFEPHTDIICRGKANKPVEFGHKVWLDEVEGGIVSDYRILEGNPPDSEQWQPSLDHHVELFGRPPYQASADRGVYSAPNEAYAQQMGVKRVILPQPGHKSEARRQHERQRWFKRGRRFHAGIEGRISVLMRKHGLDRCLYHGEEGFGRWVGWGIIAGNLAVMGAALAAR
jgi:IS5 family transposase